MAEFHYKTDPGAVSGEKPETISITRDSEFRETVSTLETIIWEGKRGRSGGLNKEPIGYGSLDKTASRSRISFSAYG